MVTSKRQQYDGQDPHPAKTNRQRHRVMITKLASAISEEANDGVAHLVLWRWWRLQKVHCWRLGRVVLGEGHPKTEFFSRVNGTFRPSDGDDPHSKWNRGGGNDLVNCVHQEVNKKWCDAQYHTCMLTVSLCVYHVTGAISPKGVIIQHSRSLVGYLELQVSSNDETARGPF